MSSEGSLIVRVYTSDANIPLEGAPVTVVQNCNGENKLLAYRVTDSSGLTAPIYADTPDAFDSLSPGLSEHPYTTVSVYVRFPGFNSVFAEGIQIFPGIETVQDLQLQPLYDAGQKGQIITEPPQLL